MQKEEAQSKGFSRKLPVDIQETLSRINEGSVEKYWGKIIEFGKDFVPLQHEYA